MFGSPWPNYTFSWFSECINFTSCPMHKQIWKNIQNYNLYAEINIWENNMACAKVMLHQMFLFDLFNSAHKHKLCFILSRKNSHFSLLPVEGEGICLISFRKSTKLEQECSHRRTKTHTYTLSWVSEPSEVTQRSLCWLFWCWHITAGLIQIAEYSATWSDLSDPRHTHSPHTQCRLSCVWPQTQQVPHTLQSLSSQLFRLGYDCVPCWFYMASKTN